MKKEIKKTLNINQAKRHKKYWQLLFSRLCGQESFMEYVEHIIKTYETYNDYINPYEGHIPHTFAVHYMLIHAYNQLFNSVFLPEELNILDLQSCQNHVNKIVREFEKNSIKDFIDKTLYEVNKVLETFDNNSKSVYGHDFKFFYSSLTDWIKPFTWDSRDLFIDKLLKDIQDNIGWKNNN